MPEDGESRVAFSGKVGVRGRVLGIENSETRACYIETYVYLCVRVCQRHSAMGGTGEVVATSWHKKAMRRKHGRAQRFTCGTCASSYFAARIVRTFNAGEGRA